MLVMFADIAAIMSVSLTLLFLFRDPQYTMNLQNEVRGHFRFQNKISNLAIVGILFSMTQSMRPGIYAPGSGSGRHRIFKGGVMEFVYMLGGVTIALDH